LTDVTARLRLEQLLGTGVAGCRAVGGQHGVRHFRVTLLDGRVLFAKLAPNVRRERPGQEAGRKPASFEAASFEAASFEAASFEAEARGLRWLAEAGAVPVPEVVGWDEAALAISWVPEEAPDAGAAAAFGRDLARLHAAGAEAFGAPWQGVIARLPLSNEAGMSWPQWYAEQRLLPYARRAADNGWLAPADVRLVEAVAERAADLAGPAEAPSRIHGDCWSGNVLWSGGRGWLIDPAAHGGHRETDLAMLALFGIPHRDRIVAGYQEVAPLADGWRERVPLHQLHPLLVHVCLFGASYRDAAVGAARAALANVR
jgi:fructosamine-3-kinase